MTIERVVPMIDEAGVDRVVTVPPTLEGNRYDYGQEAARRYPGRFATMGRVALNNPGEAPRLATNYRPRVTHCTEELPFLSENDKDWIMGKAIVERLKWA